MVPGGDLLALPVQLIEQCGLVGERQPAVHVGYQVGRVLQEFRCGPTVLAVEYRVPRIGFLATIGYLENARQPPIPRSGHFAGPRHVEDALVGGVGEDLIYRERCDVDVVLGCHR